MDRLNCGHHQKEGQDKNRPRQMRQDKGMDEKIKYVVGRRGAIKF